jgi:hypothetical protein
MPSRVKTILPGLKRLISPGASARGGGYSSNIHSSVSSS